MNAAFLYHAIAAGLDMGIVNPTQLEVYDEIDKELLVFIEDVLLNRRSDATERLIDYAETVKEKANGEKRTEEWRNGTIEERLKHALLKGVTDYVDGDTEEARQKRDVVFFFQQQSLTMPKDRTKLRGESQGLVLQRVSVSERAGVKMVEVGSWENFVE